MIVLDATVVIKLLTREPGADAALDRIVKEAERVAPDWIRAEVGNALARKVRRNGLPEAVARAGFAGLSTMVTREVATLNLLDEALDLALKLRHALYDCLYLAIAVREDSFVLTHDADFFAAARRGGMGDRVELLN